MREEPKDAPIARSHNIGAAWHMVASVSLNTAAPETRGLYDSVTTVCGRYIYYPWIEPRSELEPYTQAGQKRCRLCPWEGTVRRRIEIIAQRMLDREDFFTNASPRITRAEITQMDGLGLQLQEEHVDGAARGSPVAVYPLHPDAFAKRAAELGIHSSNEDDSLFKIPSLFSSLRPVQAPEGHWTALPKPRGLAASTAIRRVPLMVDDEVAQRLHMLMKSRSFLQGVDTTDIIEWACGILDGVPVGES